MANYIGTMEGLAAELGVHRPTLNAWKARGCPIRKTKRGYNVDVCKRWVEQQNKAPSKDDAGRLLKAQADEKEAKAELAALQLQIEKGEYVPIDEIKDRDRRKVQAVKRGLLRLPKTIASVVTGLSPPEVEKVVETKVRDLLLKFSRM